jgi:CheY-like chemotaxis protein
MEEHKPVLIVEDDEDAREALVFFLQNEGYRVLEASHGVEALDHLRHTDVCAILLDLMMPVMDGWAFRAEQMKDPHLATIPVAVITADENAMQQRAALGVEELMVKPVDLRRLLEFVDRHC